MESIGEVLNKKHSNGLTVNSKENKKELTLTEKIEAVLAEFNTKPEGIALHIAQILDDEKSKDYYLLLVLNNSISRLIEAAHLTKDVALRGKIRTKKAIYFLGILRKWKFRTKFKVNRM